MSSYLVIARKWRPSLFDEIVGQSHVTRTLVNAVSMGRIAHAYLFSGPRGVGKTTAARIFAKCLNCSNGPTATPCNSCESCKAVASGSSVDVFEIDGASNNSVENIREITESVRYVPGQGKYKVYIIDEVHMLSTQAFNALLKTLEEPPAHAVFIFATTEVHKIPATILSRCQRFDFKRIPFRQIQQRLNKIVTEEGIKFEEKALFTLAREADGSLRDSQSLLEQVLAFAGGELTDAHVSEALGLMDRSVLYELSEAIIKKDAKACLNIVEKIYNFGYDLKRALSDLLEHIRDLTVVKATGDASLLDLPDSEIERLRGLAASTGAERLHMLFAIMSRAYEEVVRSSSPRFSFEMAALRAAHLSEIQPVDELIARLEGLRNKTPDAPPQGAMNGPAGSHSAPRPGQRQDPPQAKAQDGGAKTDNGECAPDGLVGYIKKNIPSLVDIKCAEFKLTQDEIEIIVPQDKFAAFELKKKQIEDICTDYLSRRMKVKVAASGAAADKKKDDDPLIKDALRILGGRVIEDRRRTNV